jgi:quercetin dioxygenase-like cupin family protein
MIDRLTANQPFTALARSISIVAIIAIILAGCTAQAVGNDQMDHGSNGGSETVPPEVEMIVGGNVFVDTVNGQFRVKLADKEGGMRQTHVKNFNFDRGNQIFVAKLTLEPEIGAIPWHTHPGPIAASVIQGEFTVTYADDCVPRTYKAGESFLEWGTDIHKGENLHNGETVVVIVPMGIPNGAPITNPVDQSAEDWTEPC